MNAKPRSTSLPTRRALLGAVALPFLHGHARAEPGLSVVLDTSLSPSHGRSFGVHAPRTVEALARGRAEFDETRRVAIYKEMQQAALEEVPFVGLAWRAQGFGMDRRVTGFTNLPGALSTSSALTLASTALG